MSSLYFIAVFIFNDSVSILWAIPLAGAGLAALFLATTKRLRLYTPLIFVFYYFMGVLLSFADIYSNSTKRAFINHASIGSFIFSDASMVPIVIAACVGLFSVISAKIIYETVFLKKCSTKPATVLLDPNKNKIYVMRWAIIWFGISCLIIFVMSYFEIGQIGLKTKADLPLKLAGLLVFIKLVLIPAFGCLLLNLAFAYKDKKAIFIILTFIVVIALYGGVAALSRSYIVNGLLPVIAYLLLFSYRNNTQKKLLFIILGVSIPILIIGVQAIELLRMEGFSTGYLSPTTSVETLKDWRSVDFREVLSLLRSLTTEAIGGARELMASTSAHIRDLYAPVGIFVGDEDYVRDLMLSVFHFVPRVDETRAAGIGFGLWGGFMLSGSYITLFAGSFCACLIVCFVERLFTRRRLYLVGLFFSFYLSLRVWRSFYLFILARDLLMVVIFYYMMEWTLKKLRVDSIYRSDACPPRVG